MNPEIAARRAAEILADEVFRAAMTGAKERKKAQWTRATSTEERERLWHEHQAVDSVERELRVIRDHGKANKREKE